MAKTSRRLASKNRKSRVKRKKLAKSRKIRFGGDITNANQYTADDNDFLLKFNNLNGFFNKKCNFSYINIKEETINEEGYLYILPYESHTKYFEPFKAPKYAGDTTVTLDENEKFAEGIFFTKTKLENPPLLNQKDIIIQMQIPSRCKSTFGILKTSCDINLSKAFYKSLNVTPIVEKTPRDRQPTLLQTDFSVFKGDNPMHH